MNTAIPDIAEKLKTHRMFSLPKISFCLLPVLVALIFSTSCSQPRPPSLNRIRTVIFNEAFNAITAKDHRLALVKLERLQELRPDAAIIHKLIRTQKENIAITEAKNYLDAGDYKQAARNLYTTITKIGTNEKLIQERNKLSGFVKIVLYREQIPFQDAETALAEVSKLPRSNRFDIACDDYSSWRETQVVLANKLAREERKRLINEFINEMDVALATSSSRFDIIAAQLGTLMLDQEFYTDWLHVLYGNIPATTDASDNGLYHRLRMNMDVWDQTVDFSVYRKNETSGPMKENQWYNDLFSVSPATFSGTLVRVEKLFEIGNFLEGYLLYKNTIENLAMINGRNSYSALKRRYVRESGSDNFSLSVDSILNHIRSW